MEKLLNPSEVADLLGVRPGTIYSWISRKVDIPHVKMSGSIRFREKSIMEWVLQKEQERKRRNFEI